MSDFQQTIDLREKMPRPKPASSAGLPAQAGRKAAPPQSALAPLEKIYGGEEEIETQRVASLQTISQPKAETRRGAFLLLVFTLAILVAGAAAYFLFFKTDSAAVKPEIKNWYAVKLVSGEIFYGQVLDIKADPVAIDNVYYNYDQAKQNSEAKDKAKTVEETGNLRLVKRGQETHGPAGSMNIVRAQVLFMEPLKTDSKVLKAILDYEK